MSRVNNLVVNNTTKITELKVSESIKLPIKNATEKTSYKLCLGNQGSIATNDFVTIQFDDSGCVISNLKTSTNDEKTIADRLNALETAEHYYIYCGNGDGVERIIGDIYILGSYVFGRIRHGFYSDTNPNLDLTNDNGRSHILDPKEIFINKSPIIWENSSTNIKDRHIDPYADFPYPETPQKIYWMTGDDKDDADYNLYSLQLAKSTYEDGHKLTYNDKPTVVVSINGLAITRYANHNEYGYYWKNGEVLEVGNVSNSRAIKELNFSYFMYKISDKWYAYKNSQQSKT